MGILASRADGAVFYATPTRLARTGIVACGWLAFTVAVGATGFAVDFAVAPSRVAAVVDPPRLLVAPAGGTGAIAFPTVCRH